MRLAGLLTLAFTFIWPPFHHGSASPYSHAAQAETHDRHKHIEQNDPHSLLIVKMGADCDATTIGCCIMAHCCPGISVGPHDLPVFFGGDGTTAASAVPVAGIDPGLVLPPPRALPV